MKTETVYAVTGAAGHLGLNIVEQLTAAGQKVRALVLPGEANRDKLPPQAEIMSGDVRSRADMQKFFAAESGQEIIAVHCAGIVSIASHTDPLLYDVNVRGTENVADMCASLPQVKKLVYVSSVHAVPEAPAGTVMKETKDFSPEYVEGAYAKTKAEATAYVLAKAAQGHAFTVVHPSGIIGPGDYGHGHITQLVIDFVNGGLTAAVSGGYDFVDVRDVAAGVIAAAEKGRGGECYLLTNRYITVKELLDTLAAVIGRKPLKTYLPLWFAKLSAPLAEAYYKIKKEAPLYTAYSLYTLQCNAVFSHEKAAAELGYKPRALAETLRDTVEFLREAGRIKQK